MRKCKTVINQFSFNVCKFCNLTNKQKKDYFEEGGGGKSEFNELLHLSPKIGLICFFCRCCCNRLKWRRYSFKLIRVRIVIGQKHAIAQRTIVEQCTVSQPICCGTPYRCTAILFPLLLLLSL